MNLSRLEANMEMEQPMPDVARAGMIKEELVRAMKEESTKRYEYEESKRRSRELAEKYFSLRHGVKPGDVVYSLIKDKATQKRHKLRIVSFEVWTQDLDKRPDIKATSVYPFGESKKERHVLGIHWSPVPPDDWGMTVDDE
jgi:hypothetical protein